MRDRSDAESPGPTVIALDVDGVLNSFGRKADPYFMTVHVGRWPIRWRPAVMDRLRLLLLRPDVEGAWLTTWLEEPWLLDELEHVLGLDGIVLHRAGYPAIQTTDGRSHIDPRFDAWGAFVPESPHWWKLRAAELLIEQLRPARFAWADDELDVSTRTPGSRWRLGRTPAQFLVRPDPMVGLTEADLRRLEGWASEAHAGGEAAAIGVLLRDLIDGLGPTLVAAFVGEKDCRVVQRWADGATPFPAAGLRERLVCAHRVWQRVAAAEGEDVARSWFVGSTPWLHDDTVVAAIAEGRLTAVSIAAQALVDDSWSG
ncbi:MAG TPA: HAD domain-containing protein [Microbacterium sp.]|nr:HAD domain-containing protein [Microbacterium sp.]HWU33110.1 HAD domain-containing protein [Marmoricola sp.]